MSGVDYLNKSLKRLAESKKLEKKRAGWIDTEIKLTPVSFQRIKPLMQKLTKHFIGSIFIASQQKNILLPKNWLRKNGCTSY